jgi:hypothetical protein
MGGGRALVQDINNNRLRFIIININIQYNVQICRFAAIILYIKSHKLQKSRIFFQLFLFSFHQTFSG